MIFGTFIFLIIEHVKKKNRVLFESFQELLQITTTFGVDYLLYREYGFG